MLFRHRLNNILERIQRNQNRKRDDQHDDHPPFAVHLFPGKLLCEYILDQRKAFSHKCRKGVTECQNNGNQRAEVQDRRKEKIPLAAAAEKVLEYSQMSRTGHG